MTHQMRQIYQSDFNKKFLISGMYAKEFFTTFFLSTKQIPNTATNKQNSSPTKNDLHVTKSSFLQKKTLKNFASCRAKFKEECTGSFFHCFGLDMASA